MPTKDELLLELGASPPDSRKQMYDRQYARVIPKDGSAPYETWLLRQLFTAGGKLLVSHVSGPAAVFPDDADIELLTEKGVSAEKVLRTEYGYPRTECSCWDCTIYCLYMPGYLSVSDIQRMYDALGAGLSLNQWALENLLASPGALVARTTLSGELEPFRIMTLVPARAANDHCKFLDENNRCSIHAVSPFGCAMIDSHQSQRHGDELSMRALMEIHIDRSLNGPYSQLWNMLDRKGKRARSPNEAREMMAKMEKNDVVN